MTDHMSKMCKNLFSTYIYRCGHRYDKFVGIDRCNAARQSGYNCPRKPVQHLGSTLRRTVCDWCRRWGLFSDLNLVGVRHCKVDVTSVISLRSGIAGLWDFDDW